MKDWVKNKGSGQERAKMIKEACDESVVVEPSKDANEIPALPPMGVEEGGG